MLGEKVVKTEIAAEFRSSRDPDLFAETHPRVKAAHEEYEAVSNALDKQREDEILSLFNKLVVEHYASVGVEPKKAILHYRDFQSMVKAANSLRDRQMKDEVTPTFPRQSEYGDSATIFGVEIRKGCQAKPGKFVFQS